MMGSGVAHETVPLTLVATVSQSSCRSLYEKLTTFGYKDVYTVDCNEFLATVAREDRVFVVPLGNSRQSRIPANIHALLQRKPVLGVISAASEPCSEEILRFCNEFVCWPCSKKEIELRIERLSYLLQTHAGSEERRQMGDEFLRLNMVGSSPAFLHILRQIKKISRCEAPVLIEGESGTGKELTARAIHYLGVRRDNPFVPLNCGAIPDSLLENELFGHLQGSYTDARTAQEGLICQAEGGTLFLDEVETFSPKGQVILLRFLQDQQYRALGSNKHKQANVRIIAASNVKLGEMVKQGEFRMDLYYRLYIMPIIMPPLAQRGHDVLELAHYFLQKFRRQYNFQEKHLDQELIHWMLAYNWPGNVRELENMLHRGFLMADGPCIKLGEDHVMEKDLEASRIESGKSHALRGNFNEVKARVISEFEKTYLTRLLRETRGNVTLAARRAGKERRAFGKLLKKHGITKES